MRILHVLDHSLPMQSGYTFRTRAIVRAQLDRGWEVTCLTGLRHTLPGPDPERVDDILFHRTPAGGSLFAPGDPDALAALFTDRAGWEKRHETARRFVERDRNWSSNILRYIPAYQMMTGKALDATPL